MKTSSWKQIAAIAASTTLLATLTACSGSSSSGNGTALNVISAEPTSGLDPNTAVTQTSLRVMELMYDTLLDYDQKGSVVPDLRALDAVNLQIRRGEVLGLVGESGSGKTPLGRILVGSERPSSGTVEFEGQPIHSLRGAARRRFRRRVQMVFQNPFTSLNPRRTVRDVLTSGLAARGVPRGPERIAALSALMAQVGLTETMLDRYHTRSAAVSGSGSCAPAPSPCNPPCWWPTSRSRRSTCRSRRRCSTCSSRCAGN